MFASAVAFSASALLAPALLPAHPFGAPQTLSIEADASVPSVVHVRWSPGAIDDLYLLRQYLDTGEVDPTALADPKSVSFADSAAAAHDLPSDPAFKSYLLSHIGASAGEADCPGVVDPIDSLARGADLTFTCPGDAKAADISVSMLTDIHPAYRTFATGPGGVRAYYDMSHESHTWALDPSLPTVADSEMVTSPGRSAAVQVSVVLGSLVALGALITAFVSRRRRQATS